MAIKIQGTTVIDDNQGLRITGVSTFTNGPVFVGTATSTGTASQPLQVTGGAYVSGNIGVGSTNPTSKLDVVGDAKFTGVVTASSFRGDGSQLTGISASGGVSISTNTTNQAQYIPYTTSFGSTTGFGATSLGLVFNPSTTRLGIGTTNPLQNLHIQGNLLVAAGSSTGQHITQKAYELNSGTLSWEGSAGQLFSITNNLTSGSIFSVNDVSGIPSIDVNADGTVALVPYDDGNVGIATTRPTSKLHVLGNALITGIATVNSNLVVNGNTLYADTTNNRVGVGTANPGATLNVVPTSTSIAGLFSGTTSSDMVRITQLGTGNALVVEDSANPDASPFVVGAAGSVGIGTNNPGYIFTVTDTGTPATTGLTNCLADFTTTANSYGQINLRNTSTGTNASSDIIITADNGSDTTNFIDLGINNSAYSVGSWTINGANDGYLYTSDGNLSIGAINASVAKYISFFTGGTLLSNERMRINANGVGIGTTNPIRTLTVTGGGTTTTQLTVSGVSTFAGVTTSTSSLFATNLSVSGVSTFSGIATHTASLFGTTASFTGVTTSGGFNATTGNTYQIAGTTVLSNNTLGSGVVNSSLTSVGTLGQLNVSGVATFTAANNPAIQIRSGASGSYTALGIGRVTEEGVFAIASGAGIYAGNSVAGDIVIRNNNATGKLLFTRAGANASLAIDGDNVLVGTISSTGTASQPLQVTGGAYVSGNVSIGKTNPSVSLDVIGVARVGLANTAILLGNDNGRNVDVGAGSTNLDCYVDFYGTPTYTDYGGRLLRTAGDNSNFDLINRGTGALRIVSQDAGTIDFATNNTVRARIDSNGTVLVGSSSSTGTASQPLQVTGGAYVSGNLGVGATNPLTKLSVGSGSINDGNIPVQISTPSTNSQIYYGANNNGAYGALFGYDKSTYGGGVVRVVGSTDNIDFVVNNTTLAARINSSGNLGVGVTNPGAALEIINASAPQLRISNGATSGYGLVQLGRSSTASQNWHFGSEGNNYLNFWNGNSGSGVGPLLSLYSAGSTSTHAVLISGSGVAPSLTGTASQPLQVTGGAYVSGNLGIGITNPGSALALASGQGITWGATNYPAINGSNTTNTLTFSTQATERVRIDGSGNLGIGTNNPAVTLDVYNTTAATRTAIFTRGADNNFQLTAQNGTSSNVSGQEVSRFGVNYSGTGWDSFLQFIRGSGAQTGSLAIYTGNSEKVRIDSSGSVGIGTTNPTSKLDVIGDAEFTGVVTASSFKGDGSGLTNIASSPVDGQDFNTGITSALSRRLVGIGTTVLTIPSTAGKEYIVYSINAANVSTANTEVNVIGAFDFNGGERSYFAYNVPIPTGIAVELLKRPQILNPSDRITMRSTDYNRAGIDTGVEVYITYQEKTATTYFGVGLGTIGIAVTTPVAIHTATTYPSIIESIRFANRTDTGAYPVSVTVTSGVSTILLIDNLIVPKYASVEILDTPKRLNVNDVLKVQVDQTSTIDVQISGKQIT